MASIAACLMCCGVAKCGSPAPKSARSTPCALSRSASAVIAIVAETSMRLIRSLKTFFAAAVVVTVALIVQVSQIPPQDESLISWLQQFCKRGMKPDIFAREIGWDLLGSV